MLLKTMNPDEVRKALAGQEDILTPAAQTTDTYFKKLSCPSCGGECMKFVDPSRLFKDGAVLPNYMARCKVCETEFEPYTMIQVKGPKAEDGL